MPMMKIGKTVFMGEGSSYIPYSALEYNGSGNISGISGSAIAGGVDSAVVSSIVSSYVESSVSGKADQSALDDCCSAMSSVVSAKADSSSLSSYVPYSSLKNGPSTATFSAIGDSAVYDLVARLGVNNLTTSKIPYSALEYSAGTNTITAISGSAIAGQNFNPSQLQLVVDSANMSAASTVNGVQIGVKGGVFQPKGNYQTAGSYATGLSVVAVSNSSQATASNVVYIVTG